MSHTELVQDLCTFLDESPSPWHGADSARRRLEAAGYIRLQETEHWHFAAGKYYVMRGGSAIVAFRIPASPVHGWKIALAHSDSPAWRVKGLDGQPAAGYTRLPVEGYGGMIRYSWLDRPLGLAGRAVVRRGDVIETRLVNLAEDLLIIPSLAIHMQRDVNTGHNFNPAVDLQPLYGPEGALPLRSLLAQRLDVAPDDLLAADLNLVPRQKAVRLGPEGEYLAAPRIDDLECAWATLLGFLSGPEDSPAAWCLLDHEEVGSGSRQGAQSDFVQAVLTRAILAQGGDAQHAAQAVAGSFALSADNAHARHPNFPEVSDKTANVVLNGGVVLKYAASQKYTTDGLTGAVFTELMRRADIPVQVYTNRADQPGGSTLGNLLTHTTCVPMVDIGAAQLAMHSAVETTGAKDAAYLAGACKAFYCSDLHCVREGVYSLTGETAAPDEVRVYRSPETPQAPAPVADEEATRTFDRPAPAPEAAPEQTSADPKLDEFDTPIFFQ